MIPGVIFMNRNEKNRWEKLQLDLSVKSALLIHMDRVDRVVIGYAHLLARLLLIRYGFISGDCLDATKLLMASTTKLKHHKYGNALVAS